MSIKTVGAAAAAVVGTLLIAFLVMLILVYTGAYNVSAAVGHSAFGRWALETMMRNSVQARAEAEAPPFTPAMVEAGAGDYKAMCQHCHGGPGVQRAEWSKGMVPKPPTLAHAATRWSPGEIHWIVRNGVKMTAMPAFGPTHDEQAIWNITAFVKQLPAMTAEEYAAFPAGSHGSSDSGSGSSAGGHSH
jgi:mono/diheme cytochrome c family protein